MEHPGPLSPRHAERRARVLAALGPRGALILAASPELHVGADTEVRYVADPNLYYLTGYTEPDAVLVLSPALDAPYTLFVRPRDAERELWSGARGGVEEAAARYGADAALAVPELAAELPKLLGGVDTLFYRLGSSAPLDGVAHALLAAGRARRPRSGVGLHTITDPSQLLDDLRVVKDADEIASIRRACDIAVASFRELGGVIRPGAGEWEVEGALEYGFRRRGASGAAFPTIVGTGANATVLHYVSNRSVLRAGETVLVDGGARIEHYCSDISRSYPVSGRFTPEQRALFEVVKHAHDAGIGAVRPGAPVSAVHDAAVAALLDGLVSLGFLAGDPGELASQPDAWRRFYPHRTAHWLGLDVHDPGMYVAAGEGRVLEPGMVLTVEPGLYIGAAESAGPAALRGTGIRLEDDVLVTADGAEVLTGALPLDPEAPLG